MKRPHLIAFLLVLGNLAAAQQSQLQQLFARQRMVIIMFDGFGKSYYQNKPMPFLTRMAKDGFYKEVDALIPTVTNLNNSAICTGTFAATNGITGNSFLDTAERESYMESKELLLVPTLFKRLAQAGIPSALIASKKKSIGLLSAGTAFALSPETADTAWISRIGKPPDIYSAEVNYWTMRAALDVLKNRPEIRCLYIHTTDYPMHMWAPEDSNSINHLRRIDQYIQQLALEAPDAILLLTADHDVNHKSFCVDIKKVLAEKGIAIKIAISVERDKYLLHHRGFGGCSYVYVKQKQDIAAVKRSLLTITGIKTVLTRKEAAKKLHLMPGRIGDLVVLGDSTTVFGDLENSATELLPASYRSHGSTYEIKVPLIIYNCKTIPEAAYFRYNKDLIAWLFALQ